MVKWNYVWQLEIEVDLLCMETAHLVHSDLCGLQNEAKNARHYMSKIEGADCQNNE